MGAPILIPLDIPDVSAGSVANPPSGYISVFSEGGKLKQKDSTGVVTDLTLGGGGGGGSPGGSDTQVQFNDGGIFGGIASFLFNKVSGLLTIPNLLINGTDAEIEIQGITNEPTPPIAGRMFLYAKTIAGRMFLKTLGNSGFDVMLQSHSFFNTLALWQAGVTTAISVIGNTVVNVGTISHTAIADTNLKTRTRRAVNTSATTAGALASTRPTALECNRNTGFFVVARFSLDTLQAGMRAFVGLTDTATTAPTNIDPTTSTTPGKIGMAINANTGNWNLVHNITGTAPTVIALGADFPVNNTSMYEMVLYCASVGSSIGYRITNQTTGIQTSGTISTNIPALGTLLGRTIWATNNATAASVAWSMSKFGLETDY